MKIIDLLNKIANGEEVPKKIKYRYKIWNYEQRRDTDYFNYICAGDYLSQAYFLDNILNDEVEIIEEDKKIEKIPIGKYHPTHRIKKIEKKINEIIDKLNEENK